MTAHTIDVRAGRAAPSPAADPALSVAGISKRFAATTALDDVSFAVGSGRVHALLGGNGSGKSTLIKVLAGVLPAAPGGTVRVAGQELGVESLDAERSRALGLRFVHQDLGLFPDLSVAENLVVGGDFPTGVGGRVRWRELRAATRALLDRHRIAAHPDDRVGDLRPATRSMVAIARALQDSDAGTHRVLVLDEPTAALPRAEVTQLHDQIGRLRALGHTVILVSHRLGEVLEVADDFTVLRDGCHIHTGPVAGMDEARLASFIVGRALGASATRRRRPVPSGTAMVEVRNLRGGPIDDVSLQVHAGEIVGLAGLLGSGRSTLLDLLGGAARPAGGTIAIGGQPVAFRHPAEAISVGVARVPEDRLTHGVFPDRTVTENLTIARLRRYYRFPMMRRRHEERDARAVVAGPLEVRASGPHARLWSLSGGNQQKVVVGRWLAGEARVLLLDEPTQGVDAAAREILHDQIRAAADRGAAVLVATSDAEELAALADRVLVLAGGRLAGQLSGADLTAERCYHLTHLASGAVHD